MYMCECIKSVGVYVSVCMCQYGRVYNKVVRV